MRAAWALVAALVACACGPGTRAPEVAAHAVGTSSDCGQCHEAIAREWRGSRHASAWTDPLVQVEYHGAPDRSCVDCHAPLTSADSPLPRERAAHDGVDCSTCHLREGELLARAELEASELCGRCHQFRLPARGDGLAYDPDAWIQDTLGEWRRSEAARAGIGCKDCHMPARGEGEERHASHAFWGMLDRELVAEAVEVELSAERRGGTIIVDATLHPGAIGHAFPTGDLFRVAVFRVWTEERERDIEERRLERIFALGPRRDPDVPGHLSLVADTRIPPPGAGDPPHYELRLRSPAARSVAWSLELRANDSQPPAPTRSVVVARGRAMVSDASAI